MGRNCFICGLLLFIYAGLLNVEALNKVAVAALPSTQQQDFGKGFDMLFKKGLPRLEGAKPAFIYIEDSGALAHDYGIRGTTITCWIKTSDKKTEPAACIVGGVFECKLYDCDTMMKMKYEKLIPAQNCLSGRWRSIATSGKVAEEIINSLKNQDVTPSKYGLLLLQAAQLYESGAKTEANEIAGMLFKAGGYEKTLRLALGTLAGGQYMSAYYNLLESQDWVKFNAELEKIIGKFKDDWDNVRYAKAVQSAAAARAKNPEPPELKTSIPLSATDRELIASLSRMTQRDYNTSGRKLSSFWLFNNNPDAVEARKTADAFGELMAGGIKSVPLLIAMLDDESLLPFMDNWHFQRVTFSPDEFHGDENRAASLSESANHMVIPMTRGKMAVIMLQPLLLPENENEEMSFFSHFRNDEHVKEQCRAWYESIKNLGIKDLQKKYLTRGSQSQKTAVLENMVACADDTTAPQVEAALLESIPDYITALKNVDLLARYCEIRQEKAKPFIEKLRDRSYSSMDSQSGIGNAVRKATATQADTNKKLEQFFDYLTQLQSAYSMEDVVKEILAAVNDQELNFKSDKFERAAKGQPIDKIYQICLDAAVTAKDFRQKEFLLYLLPEQNEFSTGSRLDITKFKAHFEKLLEDQSIPAEKKYSSRTIQLIAARKIEISAKKRLRDSEYDNSSKHEMTGLYSSRDEKYAQYSIRRARAILDGYPVDKWPRLVNAEDLKETQILEAKLKISGKTPAEIKEFCRLATLEYLIPVGVAIQQDSELNRKLLPLANQITEAETNTDIPEVKAQIASFKGKSLNEQLLQEIFKLAEKCIQSGGVVEVSLKRSACLGGIVMKFSSTARKLNAEDENFIEPREQILIGNFSLGNASENTRKSIMVKKKSVEDSLDEKLIDNTDLNKKSEEEREKKFFETFNTAFLKDGNALWAGEVKIDNKVDRGFIIN